MTIRGDKFHSQVGMQPIELTDEERATTAREQAAKKAPENPDAKLLDASRDELFLNIFKKISKQLDKQNELTREMTAALQEVRDQGHVERETLNVLKELRGEMTTLSERSAVNESLLYVAGEVRDEIRYQHETNERDHEASVSMMAEVRDAVRELTTVVRSALNGAGHT